MGETRRRRRVVFDSTGSATLVDNTEAIAASLAGPDGSGEGSGPGTGQVTDPGPSSMSTPQNPDARILNGRFRLLREVGRGGMGVVYEAEDLRLAGRRLAVKVLPPEIAGDEAAILRLKREAETVCLLDHPNIVRLVEFDADGDCSYIVMEYLNGGNLALHLARNERLPLDEVLDAARQVCPALDFAHAKGVLHRDIKPANIMIREDGPLRQVKLTDFGIAYQVKNSMTRLTGQESAGTLLYLSPEQLRSQKPTARSDQYALAVTLYELLSGEPPFAGAGLAHQVLTNPPAPVDGVPDAVNAALARALSKDPAARFGSCVDFLAALEARAAAAPSGAHGVAPQAAAVAAAVTATPQVTSTPAPRPPSASPTPAGSAAAPPRPAQGTHRGPPPARPAHAQEPPMTVVGAFLLVGKWTAIVMTLLVLVLWAIAANLPHSR